MSIYDEYRIVVNGAQRRLIMRALTRAMADDRRSTDALGPTPDEWIQLIRLFSTIKPSSRKDHLGHVIFEARRADAVMRFVNGRVCIQGRVVHNPINEVVNYGSNRIDATKTLVERRLAVF